jgi:hypothetical protein
VIKNTMVVARDLGKRGTELLFDGYRVSVLQNERFLETDSDDSYTTMQKYLIPMNSTSKGLRQ